MSMISKSTRQAAFTLIELVIVIVLLGILAATALPKFADITTQARGAAAQGVAGALGAAANVAHSQWLASGSPASITLEGTTIIMSSQGWPEATSGTANGTATAAKCLQVWEGVLQNPPSAASGSCTGSCEYLAGGSGSACTFQDQQGSGSNTINYDISNGSVSIS